MKRKQAINSQNINALCIVAHQKSDAMGVPQFKHVLAVGYMTPVVNSELLIEKLTAKNIPQKKAEKIAEDLNVFLDKVRDVGKLHDLLEDYEGKKISGILLEKVGFDTSLVPEENKFGNEVLVDKNLLKSIGVGEDILGALDLLNKKVQKIPKNQIEDYLKYTPPLYESYSREIRESGNDLAIMAKFQDNMHNNSEDRLLGSLKKAIEKSKKPEIGEKAFDIFRVTYNNYYSSLKKAYPVVKEILSKRSSLGLDELNWEKELAFNPKENLFSPKVDSGKNFHNQLMAKLQGKGKSLGYEGSAREIGSKRFIEDKRTDGRYVDEDGYTS